MPQRNEIIIGTRVELSGLKKGEKAVKDFLTTIIDKTPTATKAIDELVGAIKDDMAKSVAIGNLYSQAITSVVSAFKDGTRYIADFSRETLQLSYQIGNIADNTGIAVENVNAIARAFELAGRDIEDGRDLLNDFAERLGDARTGNKTYAESFEAIGVSLDQDVNTALEETIDNLSAMDDRQQALFRGIEIFGNDYKLIAQQLDSGNILKGGGLFSDRFLENSQTLRENTKTISTEFKTLLTTALEPLVEEFADFSTQLADSEINVNKFAWEIQQLSNIAGLALDGIHGLALGMNLITQKETTIIDALNARIKSYSELSIEELEGIKDGLTEILAPADEANAKMLEIMENSVNNAAVMTAAGDRLFEGINQDQVKRSRVLLAGLERELARRGAIANINEEQTETINKQNKEYERSAKAIKHLNGSSWERIEVIDTEALAIEKAIRAKERELEIREQEEEKAQEIAELKKQFALDAFQYTEQIADIAFESSIAREQALLENQKKGQQEYLNSIVVSGRRRNQIEQQFAKENEAKEKEIAKRRGRMQIANAWADVARGIIGVWSQDLSKFGTFGIPMAIGTSAMLTAIGTAQTASIASQMQGFATGGIVGGGGTNPSMGSDTTVATVRDSEMVLNAEQQTTLFEMANGRASGGATYNINIGGNVTNDQLSELEDMLRSLQDNGRLTREVVS